MENVRDRGTPPPITEIFRNWGFWTLPYRDSSRTWRRLEVTRSRSCGEQTPSRGGASFMQVQVTPNMFFFSSMKSFHFRQFFCSRKRRKTSKSRKYLKIKEIYPQLAGIALQPHSNLTIGLLKRVINLNDDWGVNVVNCIQLHLQEWEFVFLQWTCWDAREG